MIGSLYLGYQPFINCTNVWSYMEINAANALSNFFFLCGKPSFVEKKWISKKKKKKKIGELSTKEIQYITDNAAPVKTKRP